MKNILCCDIGTSSLKAAIISSDGTCAVKTRVQLASADSAKTSLLWYPALKTAVEQMKDTLKDCSFPDINAISISGNGPTLVSDNGTTLMWNQNLQYRVSDQLAGKYPESIYIPRMELFKETFAEEYNRTSYIYCGPEYLAYILTGNSVSVLPESRFIEWYWPENYDSKLPPYTSPLTSIGGLKEDKASDLGLPCSIPVYSCGPDFIAALTGTDTLSPGKICDRAGSSEGINLCTSKEVHAEGLRTMPSVIPGLWNASYIIPKSGSRFTDFINQLENVMGIEVSYDSFFDVIMGSNNNSPLFEQGKYTIIQTALQTQDGLKLLAKTAFENGEPFPGRIIMCGGQGLNDTWCHIKADITGIELEIPELTDAELTGDAIFALTGLGEYTDIQAAAKAICTPGKTYEPENN